MKYGCIGEHLSHSFSKEIHNMISDYDYELSEIKKEDLASFLKKRDFLGINVTIPYKEAVIPYLDHISENAKKIGAVNTVINKNSELFGYNSDYFGLKELIKRNKTEISGKKALILGTGGSSKTADAVLNDLGAKEIIFVSHSGKPNAISYEEASKMHSDADIIVNTTPVGMFPNPENMPIDISAFPNLSGIIDLIYNPLKTRLILEAEKRGIPCASGLYMLISQAIYASELFFDKKYGIDICEKIYRSIYKEKQNIVLIGMPSCGKTSIGKMLAKETDREFFDIDLEIEKAENMTVKQIFESFGEDHFRRTESKIIAEISKKNGIIIACGGGSILREENIANLKSNGKIYLIQRPIEMLCPTESRPLFNDKKLIEKLYLERKNIYLSSADRIIDNSGNIENAIYDIKKDFYDENTDN